MPSTDDAHAELALDPDSPGPLPLHLRPSMVAWVVLGGVVGTGARIGLEALTPRPEGLPLPTLAVNLLGAFVLGWLLEALARLGPDVGRRRVLRLLVGTGFCGAFTTYSSLTVDAVQLADAGRLGTAAGYLAVSLVVGAAATTAGIAVASARSAVARAAGGQEAR